MCRTGRCRIDNLCGRAFDRSDDSPDMAEGVADLPGTSIELVFERADGVCACGDGAVKPGVRVIDAEGDGAGGAAERPGAAWPGDVLRELVREHDIAAVDEQSGVTEFTLV